MQQQANVPKAAGWKLRDRLRALEGLSGPGRIRGDTSVKLGFTGKRYGSGPYLEDAAIILGAMILLRKRAESPLLRLRKWVWRVCSARNSLKHLHFERDPISKSNDSRASGCFM